jgi:hypothetical protein
MRATPPWLVFDLTLISGKVPRSLPVYSMIARLRRLQRTRRNYGVKIEDQLMRDGDAVEAQSTQPSSGQVRQLADEEAAPTGKPCLPDRTLRAARWTVLA